MAQVVRDAHVPAVQADRAGRRDHRARRGAGGGGDGAATAPPRESGSRSNSGGTREQQQQQQRGRAGTTPWFCRESGEPPGTHTEEAQAPCPRPHGRDGLVACAGRYGQRIGPGLRRRRVSFVRRWHGPTPGSDYALGYAALDVRVAAGDAGSAMSLPERVRLTRRSGTRLGACHATGRRAIFTCVCISSFAPDSRSNAPVIHGHSETAKLKQNAQHRPKTARRQRRHSRRCTDGRFASARLLRLEFALPCGVKWYHAGSDGLTHS